MLRKKSFFKQDSAIRITGVFAAPYIIQTFYIIHTPVKRWCEWEYWHSVTTQRVGTIKNTCHVVSIWPTALSVHALFPVLMQQRCGSDMILPCVTQTKQETHYTNLSNKNLVHTLYKLASLIISAQLQLPSCITPLHLQLSSVWFLWICVYFLFEDFDKFFSPDSY